MLVLERQPEVARLERLSELRVERTDISFMDVPGNRVRIQVTVENVGSRRSRPTPMKLESAPLGAFVPWRPLAQMLVPALEAGESTELNIEVERPKPTPLGGFDRVPPKRLLTALSSPDGPAPDSSTGPMALMDFLRRRRTLVDSRNDSPGTTALAPDLWDLLGRGQPHWAGNINVFIGRNPVERHVAKALRIYPGRMNLAMFVVGEPGQRDAYAFELVGLAPSWEAGLFDMGSRHSLKVSAADCPIEELSWVEAAGGMMMLLSTRPPADCRTGKLEVHVTRRSSGTTAVVEFDLNPAAQGPGCYFV